MVDVKTFADRVNPRDHLPAGRILDKATEKTLYDFWASVDFRELTAEEIQNIVGAPLETPKLKTEWGTGQYPASRDDKNF